VFLFALATSTSPAHGQSMPQLVAPPSAPVATQQPSPAPGPSETATISTMPITTSTLTQAATSTLTSTSTPAPTATSTAWPISAALPTPGQPATSESLPPQAAGQWTAYGFNVTAAVSMFPMLEELHKFQFDWELASASERPTPLVWADLPNGVFGEYDRTADMVKLSNVLLMTSVEARTAFLAHELTHLNDDLNGRLVDSSSTGCYESEVRAFQNEANFWNMVFGPNGKPKPDPIEARENTKMWAFLGNAHFTDLVVRTTPSYIHECGVG
jgi:hypothetical protein